MGLPGNGGDRQRKTGPRCDGELSIAVRLLLRLAFR
jgi:hypothetical protein